MRMAGSLLVLGLKSVPWPLSEVKLRWTQAWRRQNKKGKVEEGGKKKARKVRQELKQSTRTWQDWIRKSHHLAVP